MQSSRWEIVKVDAVDLGHKQAFISSNGNFLLLEMFLGEELVQMFSLHLPHLFCFLCLPGQDWLILVWGKHGSSSCSHSWGTGETGKPPSSPTHTLYILGTSFWGADGEQKVIDPHLLSRSIGGAGAADPCTHPRKWTQMNLVLGRHKEPFLTTWLILRLWKGEQQLLPTAQQFLISKTSQVVGSVRHLFSWEWP